MPMEIRDTPAVTEFACVGAGLVGSAWAIIFARAGLDVALHDANPATSTSR
jgi:3-hydroxyacyl-CoA dehydrogenase